jgi:hypothetical protein
MDNHRAALWCWLQILDLNQSHSIIHIDRHADTLQSRLDEWLKNLPPSWDLSIEEYLDHSYETELGAMRLFGWDNYLSIYFAVFGDAVGRCLFATHGDGDKPNHSNIQQAELWTLPENLDYWLEECHSPWIVNIDLDYFFYSNEDSAHLMVSEVYLKTCFEKLKKKMNDGVVAVTTICLTPDEQFTGGWNPSAQLAEKICTYLEIDFRLQEASE